MLLLVATSKKSRAHTSKKDLRARVEGRDSKHGIKPSKHNIFEKTKMLGCKVIYGGPVFIVIGKVQNLSCFFIYIYIVLVAVFGKTTIYIYIYIYICVQTQEQSSDC